MQYSKSTLNTIAQTVQRLSMDFTVRGSNSNAGEIFWDRPWDPPYLLYNGYQLIPDGKWAVMWRWPPNPYIADV